MELKKVQQEALTEWEKHEREQNRPNHYDQHDFLNSLTARVYAAALDAVESGMPKEQNESEILPADQVQGERQKEAQNKEIGICHGWNLARKELIDHLRSLREGITGNEHAK